MGGVAAIDKEGLRIAHSSAPEVRGEVLSGPERRGAGGVPKRSYGFWHRAWRRFITDLGLPDVRDQHRPAFFMRKQFRQGS
jgi:hypothetical protein